MPSVNPAARMRFADTLTDYNIMGDKSPKANQKKNSQKQSAINVADIKKKQAIAAKQAASIKVKGK